MEYQPLQDETNEIRLITIIPAEGEEAQSTQISCRLDIVSLDDKYLAKSFQAYKSDTDEFGKHGDFQKLPATSNLISRQGLQEWIEVLALEDDATAHLPDFRYTWGDFMALSYTWGDPSVTREILVNGHSMRITENAEACLRVLRGKPYIKKGWRIWIDALCSNQGDIVERAFQVKRMRDIYREAWTPIIWLGDGKEESDGAMALIKDLAHAYTMNDQANALTQALHRDPSHFGKGNWRALHQLAIRRYWSRIWILQEVAMGRKNTPVLCGQQTLPWIDISRAFALLAKTDEVLNNFMRAELEDASLEFSISIWSTLSTVGEIQLLQDAQIGHRPGNLFRLLHLGRTVFAADPRDKVYGVLWLMEPSLSSLIVPDYTAQVVDVYTDFANATIRATESLDIIRHRYPTKDDNLPSWVPDLTKEPITSTLDYSSTNFATSGTSKADIQYVQSSRLLPCRGFRIDELDGMGCIWSESWSPDTIEQTDGVANPYGSLEDIREAIWKTLIASRNIEGEPIHDHYSSLLATPALADLQTEAGGPLSELIRSNIFEVLKNNSTLKICGRELCKYFENEVPPGSVDPVYVRDGLMQQDHITVRRRFVTTAKGYTGMALETMRKGDGIYVLLGCTVPVVLRQAGEKFEFIGECYIHGVMEGEAMEWLKTGECQVTEIVLC